MTRSAAYAVLQSSTSTVVVTHDDDVPRIVHWGATLPAGVDAPALAALDDPAVPQGGLDVVPPLSLLPERSRGWSAYGGLDAHRADGRDWAPRLVRTSSTHRDGTLTWAGADPTARVTVTVSLALGADGVLVVSAEVVNDGDTDLHVTALAPALPLPARADESLTLVGRWAKELQEQRAVLGRGALVLENRRGRTSHESAPTVMVGTRSFGEQHGEVWAAHLGWSGNHHLRVESLPDGRRFLSLAELLLPGEVRLAPGESYAAPSLYGVYSGHGLGGVSDAFHAHVRGRASHPATPRPVILNTWEAVYFRHNVPELQGLAEVAASVGVERFVLDDGWFRGRDDDTTSLGDWYVDERKYPHGLGELVDHVVGLGLEFGLWVEPEMVNPDSDLFRAHPDWVLGIDGQEPVLGRHQLVLDLARIEVSAYLLERLDALLSAFRIGYLKWDMNRDLVAAGHRGGAAGVHAQTLALYALLDELRRRHPRVEIESCSSGGARVDLGIAARTDRFWTSDCNDALERQRIQRTFSYLLPPELMGAHVGPTWSHTTARTHTLPFRAATALFGHLGFEWDLATASAEDRAGVAQVIEVHKRFRPLLHGGRTVRVDHPDGSALVHGVVAPDRGEALFCYAQLSTTDATTPVPMRLVGLDPARRYRVERVLLPGATWSPGKSAPRWYDAGLEADGALLAQVGVPLGVHVPESATLVHVTALG
ncbi:MAG: alpha-galactosidase [Actinomycetales bacterium]|nr:alpha-galactosidase [Actinomycetales bacterium]